MSTVTRILLTPLVQAAEGTRRTAARLTAVPTFTTRTSGRVVLFKQLLTWDLGEFATPIIDVEPPIIGSAWIFTLVVGHTAITRTVTFIGEEVEWGALTDVDPDTLAPDPPPEEVAAWEAVRDQVAEEAAKLHLDFETAIGSHIQAPTPHPAYDDIPDLTLLFENLIVNGLIPEGADDLPDLATIFDENL